MIQFIHVYLNITILYQGDAMQISNLVSQYNNSVANGEPMTGAKGWKKSFIWQTEGDAVRIN